MRTREADASQVCEGVVDGGLGWFLHRESLGCVSSIDFSSMFVDLLKRGASRRAPKLGNGLML